MKADITRDTFDATKQFSRVLMQQGRVQLDADFNEQAAILLHYLRALAADLIGPYGGPKGNAGFEIGNVSQRNFTIGAGHYYVDGLLVENGSETNYRAQSGSDAPTNGPHLAYLDVWERQISALQDSSIYESALGELDTCARTKVEWQVRLMRGPDRAGDCTEATKLLTSLARQDRPRMAVQLLMADTGDICSLPPDSRYRGLENQLYRVEVHRGNIGPDGRADATLKPTIKWSRDNGSVVFPIKHKYGATVVLHSLGKDARCTLNAGDWVEISDDATELSDTNLRPMFQVESVDMQEMTVTLEPSTTAVEILPNSQLHPILRRWDQRGKGVSDVGITVDGGETKGFPLEAGIEVTFKLDTNLAFRPGDYWLIPARVATGSIEWPYPASEYVEARGVHHHYAPLAIIDAQGKATDCRKFFDTIVDTCPPT